MPEEKKDYKSITLLQIIKAFLVDNNAWLSKNMKGLTNSQSMFKVPAGDENKVKQFITVISGNGDMTGSYRIDPSLINIYISNDRVKELTGTIQSTTNSMYLIQWLNAVLTDNGISTLSAGDQKSLIDTTGHIILFWDYTQATNDIKSYIKLDDAMRRINASSGINDSFDENLEKRIQDQDDVFSFRFKGSLIESINIEKVDSPKLQTILSANNLAYSVEGNTNEITPIANSDKPVEISSTEQKFREGNNAVTTKDKQFALTLLYATMSAATIQMIGHPWVRIAKPIGIKGTGFFDGKYLVTKVKHTISSDNKFTTTVTACRILDALLAKQKEIKAEQLQEKALNTGSVNLTTKPTILPLAADYKKPAEDPNKPRVIVDNTSIKGVYQNYNSKTITEPKTDDVGWYKLNSLHSTFRDDVTRYLKRYENDNLLRVNSIDLAYIPLSESYDAANEVESISLHNFGMALTFTLKNLETQKIYDSNTSDIIWKALFKPTVANHIIDGYSFRNISAYHTKFSYLKNVPINYLSIDTASRNGVDNLNRLLLLKLYKKQNKMDPNQPIVTHKIFFGADSALTLGN